MSLRNQTILRLYILDLRDDYKYRLEKPIRIEDALEFINYFFEHFKQIYHYHCSWDCKKPPL